ncbi:hypothetical protein [uncultured Lacinutrix sp.]|uniref:hypothetical protein n=1 Tax=uncultured Lacinutrix sp. TaxID=574032 RepID=UPI00261BCD47|nr:hypothetical protein [uncultured Lacinutrix sp.]
MCNFLYDFSGTLTKLLELMAAITAALLFPKYKNTPVKYFIYFLWYVFIIECIGGYTVYVHRLDSLSHIKEYLSTTWMRSNNWWYTITWTIGSALFYAFYFTKLIINKSFKIILKYLSFIFIIFSIISIAAQWDAFFTTNLIGISLCSTILIIISILFYLIEILKSEKILNFYRSVNVYISLSILLWTVIIAPLVFFSMYFNKEDWSYVCTRTIILFFANVFLYSCFTVGFIVSKPENEE